MDNENPFAAPNDAISPVNNTTDAEGLVWRAGKLLVFTPNAALPERCIKCNTTHEVTMRQQKLYYYPPWIVLFIFCNLIVLIIVAMIFRKASVEHLGVCEGCWRRRRNGIILSCGLLLSAVVLFVSMAILPESLSPQAPAQVGIPLLLAALACLVAAAVVGLMRGQLLVVRKIDKIQVRLSRINREYLARLPEGP